MHIVPPALKQTGHRGRIDRRVTCDTRYIPYLGLCQGDLFEKSLSGLSPREGSLPSAIGVTVPWPDWPLGDGGVLSALTDEIPVTVLSTTVFVPVCDIFNIDYGKCTNSYSILTSLRNCAVKRRER
jgi:hypothetical protein